MIGHGDQSFFRPSFEPVHRAARDEPGELERPTAKLVSHLHADRIPPCDGNSFCGGVVKTLVAGGVCLFHAF